MRHVSAPIAAAGWAWWSSQCWVSRHSAVSQSVLHLHLVWNESKGNCERCKIKPVVICWLVFQLKTMLFALELYGPGPQGVWIRTAASGVLMSTSTSSWDLATHIWGFGGRVGLSPALGSHSPQDGGTIGVSPPRHEPGEQGLFLRDGRNPSGW